MPDFTEVRAVKRDREDALLDAPGVYAVGVGERTGELSITVSVRPDAPDPDLPAVLNGVPVAVETRDERPTTYAPEYNETRFRPVPMGASMTNANATACTNAFIMEDPSTGELYTSSNNHCFARFGDAFPGEEIIQPSPYDDGGTPGDTVATFEDAVPVDGGENYVDFAWAEPEDGVGFLNGVYTVGAITAGPIQPELGDTLEMVGRTSGYQEGDVTDVDVTITMDDWGESYTFYEQVRTDAESSGGDSGSPYVLKDEFGDIHPAGINWAGSSGTSLLSPAPRIESESGLEFYQSPNFEDHEVTVEECRVVAAATPEDTYNVALTIQNDNATPAGVVVDLYLDGNVINHRTTEVFEVEDEKEVTVTDTAPTFEGDYPVSVRVSPLPLVV